MTRSATLHFAIVASLTLGLFACTAPPEASLASDPVGVVEAALEANIEEVPMCQGGRWKCYARCRLDRATHAVAPHAGSLGAGDLQSAYGIDPNATGGLTVAIIDAFGYAKAESDLAKYRSMYNLPPCTVASGCLT